jgi:hypothetical protein
MHQFTERDGGTAVDDYDCSPRAPIQSSPKVMVPSATSETRTPDFPKSL